MHCASLGVAPSQAQLAALLAYLDLLERWNATYNLTAVRDRKAMLTHHLADCIAVLPALQRQLPAGRLLDVGSGGGLPGVVIAVLHPEVEVTCVDTVGKKAAFIRQVAGLLCLNNLRAVHGRVEQMAGPLFDVVASRAFASLADIVALTRGLLSERGVWMAMKGKWPATEIDALPIWATVFHVEPLLVPGLDAERCLVWMKPAADEGRT